ncbi:MAG: GIY-YIG nuclease family protein [Microbacterium sp.]
MAWTYILRCRDGSYYVGSTEKDPLIREWEHNNDETLAARHTITRRPVVVIHVEHFERTEDAFRRERQLHGWSRAKKEALMAGDVETLRKLSRARESSVVRRSDDDPSASSGTGGPRGL